MEWPACTTAPGPRQLASSGRRRVRHARPSTAPAARHTAVVREFERAWQAKDIAALVGLLDPGATATADGGGRALAFPHPIVGAERIAHAWVDIAGRRPAGTTFVERTVGGRPGLVAEQDGVVVTVFAFDIAGDGRIRHIWVVRNPDKLRHWTAA